MLGGRRFVLNNVRARNPEQKHLAVPQAEAEE